MSTRIPIVPGDGRPAWFQDSEDYTNLVLLPEACSQIEPKLWDLFAVEQTAHAAVVDDQTLQAVVPSLNSHRPE